ncbi:hypothetical protein [Micromonospora mirobrigensis]|uniref:Uncharacterized protein n=1 Tax=Micromonospora mirobrigensis TaxID=262898 RepID=A0A1C4URD3_9ACTN|nr:hypothetical protein [Micromonospora mirobrigensis]SCE74289.1 hypothetical protein GA0070564_101668 [Micromonospora mirobrigensis]
MRDDVTFVERLHRDLRDVPWPEAAELRATARRRTRRTAVTAAAAVLVVVAGVAVAARGPAGPPPGSTVAAPPGGRAEIPVEALLDPRDLPDRSDERLGDAGLGEPVTVDPVLRSCALDRGLPADPVLSRYSRSQTLITNISPGGLAPERSPLVSQDVYRLDRATAERFMVDLDRLVIGCTGWQETKSRNVTAGGSPRPVTLVHRWTVVDRDFAGDAAIVLRHTTDRSWDATTGADLDVTTTPEVTVIVRVGDLVTVLVPAGPMMAYFEGAQIRPTGAELRDLGRAAARRMCAAANPGC